MSWESKKETERADERVVRLSENSEGGEEVPIVRTKSRRSQLEYKSRDEGRESSLSRRVQSSEEPSDVVRGLEGESELFVEL